MTLLSTATRQMLHTNSNPTKPPVPVDMSRVTTLILGGGEGRRLAPLTSARCKPAICFGGKYLLVDIPISNAINSGCQKIYVLTQFLSATLHQHIYRTYRPGTISQAFIELLTAEQGPDNRGWFQGTADAVRQNLGYLEDIPSDYFLILSGDQVYNMNYQHMLRFAMQTNADLVIAALPVSRAEAKRMGVLKINEDRFITEFCEKPQDKALLEHMRLQEFTLKELRPSTGSKRSQYLGSMGIYLFKRQALFDLLKKDPREDFGKHLIPTILSKGNVAAYLFNGYWEDIGTIESFYHANIAMTQPNPPFDCYDETSPVFSYHHHLPSPKISNTVVNNAIICEGAICQADEVTNSILGPRSVVKAGSIIRNSYVMGNDYYSTPLHSNSVPIDLEIGENCFINQAIIDKNVSIGNNVRLINKNKLTHYTSDHVHIRDGIIVVTRGARIPDGFTL